MNDLGTLVRTQLMQGFVYWTLNFILYSTTTLSGLAHFVVSYEICNSVVSYEMCEFFSKIMLALLGPCISIWILWLFLIINFCDFSKMWLDFDRDYIESEDQFGKYCHLITTLSFPIHDHRLSFHYLDILWFFQQRFVLFTIQDLYFFVQFISKYFILSDFIANGIVFLISFSDCLLLI